MTLWRPSAFLLLCCLAVSRAGAADLLAEAKRAEARHDFDRAAAYLEEALANNPRHAQAWLDLASLATVTGDITTARQACSAASLHLEILAAVACRGRIALATGEHAVAYETLAAVLSHPLNVRRTDEIAQWAAAVAAELAVAVGKHDAADRYFRRALQTPAPVQVRAAWLDHLLATDRARAVVDAVPVESHEVALQVRRLQALGHLGRQPQAAGEIAYLDWLFRQAMDEHDFTHGREMALFYLAVKPDPTLALRAAAHNIEHQREAQDLYLYRQAAAQHPGEGVRHSH